ncbi:MAG: efflux RND transporter permease subunit [Candidatus Sabulitectum sp.]|nr:efflux RND transporter permease subunit [Candidatus Sabulitectum sp.]
MKRMLSLVTGNPVPVLVVAAMLAAVGIHSASTIPVDALPDVSENQVIIAAAWEGRSPEEVYEQITLPLTGAVSGLQGMTGVRGMSAFGFSQLYVVFSDDMDFYTARTRVMEKVAEVTSSLPSDARITFGPDATALGQIFWYTVDGPQNSGILRDLHDDVIARQLLMVAGVAEVAGVGGFSRELIVEADPAVLWQHGIDLSTLLQAVQNSGGDFAAGALEISGMEIVVEGLTEPSSPEELRQTVVVMKNGIPVRVGDIAQVYWGPGPRRGILADESGETVGGIVTMRMGANPVDVINGVEEQLELLKTALPEGVSVNPYYDRRTLIEETTKTLTDSIIWEIFITIGIVFFFLRRAREALLVAASLPFAILLCFIAMKILNVPANIMSYAGIAVAIGTLVDMGIVMVEAVHRRTGTIAEAAHTVAGPILTSLGTTIISFIPVFFLTGQSGKLFQPLAWTKTLVLAGAGLTAFTLIPAAAKLFLSKPEGRIRLAFAASLGLGLLGGWTGSRAGLGTAVVMAMSLSLLGWWSVREQREKSKGPGLLERKYKPLLTWCMGHRSVFIALPVLMILLGFTALSGLGTQFMPPLDEGSFLFMPSLLPAGSLNETGRVMENQNAALAAIPEVNRVVGKAGRADSPLDPAPAGMIETVITLDPQSSWREGVTEQDILDSLRVAVEMPGIAPSWLQPIETRIVMLQSGIRTSIGIEIHGEDPLEAERIAIALEGILRDIPGTRDISALRTGRKPYARISVDRERAALLGIPMSAVSLGLRGAIGGVVAGEIVDGYSSNLIRVRYLKDFRDRTDDLERVLVSSVNGIQYPLSMVAAITTEPGPAAIRSVSGDPVAYLMLNASGRDQGSLIQEADRVIGDIIREERDMAPEERVLDLPEGYWYRWVGDWQNQQEARKRFILLLPLCLLSIFLLMYAEFKTFSVPAIIFAGSIPVAVSGGLLGLRFWPAVHNLLENAGLTGAAAPDQINITVAVVVGFIALLGICVDDGVLMASNITRIVQKAKPETVSQLRSIVVQAGTMRIRPAVMTTVTTIVALIPVLLASGRGSTLARPMAIPVFGGMILEFLSMLIVPVVYSWWLERKLQK